MATITVRWVTEITEVREVKMEYADFANMVRASGDKPPTLKEIQAGEEDLEDFINADDLTGHEDKEHLESATVDARYVDEAYLND